MCRIIKNKYYIVIAFIFVYFLHGVNIAFSQSGALNQDIKTKITNQDFYFANKAGFAIDSDIGVITKMVIQGFLGLLGIIFIILMLTAGYNWMTASGNEEKLKKAQITIRMAIIGLIITVFAYAITYFVFSALPFGSGTGGPGGPGGTP